jgi:hypothetical protein
LWSVSLVTDDSVLGVANCLRSVLGAARPDRIRWACGDAG